jgi:hypothetical protein
MKGQGEHFCQSWTNQTYFPGNLDLGHKAFIQSCCTFARKVCDEVRIEVAMLESYAMGSKKVQLHREKGMVDKETRSLQKHQ